MDEELLTTMLTQRAALLTAAKAVVLLIDSSADLYQNRQLQWLSDRPAIKVLRQAIAECEKE